MRVNINNLTQEFMDRYVKPNGAILICNGSLDYITNYYASDYEDEECIDLEFCNELIEFDPSEDLVMYEDGDGYLQFIDCVITNKPKSIRVTHIDFSGSSIVDLPVLACLSIILRRTKVSTLEGVIPEGQYIKTLDISYTNITELDPNLEIGELIMIKSKVKKLNASSIKNSLIAFGSTLEDLEGTFNGHTLMLQQTKIKTIPACFKIRFLDIAATSITYKDGDWDKVVWDSACDIVTRDVGRSLSRMSAFLNMSRTGLIPIPRNIPKMISISCTYNTINMKDLENRRIGIDLDLSDSAFRTDEDNDTKIFEIPKSLIVEGNLLICGTNLTVPTGYTAYGNLDMRNCHIDTFPKDLTVFGSLLISEGNFESLDPWLYVRDSLSIANCPNLAVLSCSLMRIPHNFILAGCPKVDILGNMVVGGIVDLNKSGVKRIKDSFVVGDHIVNIPAGCINEAQVKAVKSEYHKEPDFERLYNYPLHSDRIFPYLTTMPTNYNLIAALTSPREDVCNNYGDSLSLMGYDYFMHGSRVDRDKNTWWTL